MATLRIPVRAAAVALGFSGVAWAVATPLHPSIFGGDVPDVVLRTGSWQAIHLVVMAGAIAAILGIAGLVAAHGGFEPYGLPLVGATTVGAAVTAAIMFAEAVTFPTVAAEAPGLLALDGPMLGSAAVRVAVVLAGLYPVGLVVAGVLAARADLAPTAGRWLAGSTVAFLVLGGPFVPILGPLATAVSAAVHVWWAAVLWRVGTDPAPQRGASADTSGNAGYVTSSSTSSS